jgi:hypothetical protein
MRFAETTFRPLFGRILAVVVAVAGVAGIVSTALAADVETTLRVAAPTGLVVVLVVAAYWFPRVEVREDEVEVRNVFTTFHVPWGAIRRIDTKWSLTLLTDTVRVTAWASPAPGRHATLWMTRGEAQAPRESAKAGGIRPGDSLQSESGAVAHVIRTHWEQLRDDDLLDAPNTGTTPRRELHVATIVATAVLAVATVLSFTL